MPDGKPLTYKEWLPTTGLPDGQTAQSMYQAYRSGFAAPAPTTSPALQKADAERMAGLVKPIQDAAGVALHLFPPTAVPALLYDAVTNSKKPNKPTDAAGIPKNPLQTQAETVLGRPVESQTEMANRLGWPNSPDTAKRYNAALQGMINDQNTATAAQHQPPAYIGQNASPGAPVAAAPKPAGAPVATPPAAVIPTVEIPSVADKPAEVQTVIPPNKDSENAKTTGKIISGLVGGLGDAFNASAAALQGRGYTPEQSMQREQNAFTGEQNAANRAQAAGLQAQSLMVQQEIAKLQAKTSLTQADKDNLAALVRTKAQIDGNIQAALIGRGIVDPNTLPKGYKQPDMFGLR